MISTDSISKRFKPRRWLVLFGGFYVSFCVDGFLFSFGLPKLEIEREYPDIPKELVSMIPGIYSTLYCLFAPMGMALLQSVGLKAVIISGSLIQVTGFLLTLVNRWLGWGFAFDLICSGIITGLAGAILLGPSIVGMLLYFPDRKSIATGVTTAGSPAGTLVYGFLFQYFLIATPLSWRGVMIFYAILAGIMAALALTFYDPNAAAEHVAAKQDQQIEKVSMWQKFVVAFKKQFSKRIWNRKNWALHVFLVATTFSILGYPVPTLLISGQAEDPAYGVSPGVQKNLIFIWGISNLASRIVFGIITHAFARRSRWFTSFSIFAFSLLVSGIVVLVFPHLMIYGDASFITFIAVYGFSCAPFISLRSIFLDDLFYPDTKTVETTFGWQLVSDAIFAWVGFFVSTYLNRISPVYAYSFAGSALIAAAISITATYKPYFRALSKMRHRLEEKARRKAERVPLQDGQTTLTPDNN